MPPGAKRTPLRGEPFDGLRQVVDPESDVVERRFVYGRLLCRIERLHQVDFDLERAAAHLRDVLVDVFTLADVIAVTVRPNISTQSFFRRSLEGPPMAIC
jgi:hypothetical protein